MRKVLKSRKVKYGSITVLLTALVIVAVIIVNIILAMLSGRYEWMYQDMNSYPTYDVSENCREYIEEYVISRVDEVNGSSRSEKIKLIFCEERETLEENESTKYSHKAIYQISDMFPGYFEISYLNVWEKPSVASSYGVTSTSDVICEFNGRHETINLADLYVYDTATSSAVAYNGEKIISSCLMRVTQEDEPNCYLTVNHGESFADYEFMRSLVEAGYTVGYIDLAESDIPADCDLLVTFAPKQDLIVSGEISSVSETDKLDAYMSRGGKYMVFLSADTFASGPRANLEEFLAKWGIEYVHSTGDDGSEDVHVVRDLANSVTVDGYSVLARPAAGGLGASIADGDRANVFANTARISFSSSFKSDNNGNFVNQESGITAYPVMVSHSSAEAWMDGRAVLRASEDPFVLMAMASRKCENGETAMLLASASTDFACESAMQSAVLGNNRTMARIYRQMGRENAPIDLVFKTFSSTEIEGLSTRNANIIAIVSAAVPTVAVIALGTVVLLRRKYS